MSAELSIEFPASDVRAVMRSMRRAQSELGVTMGQSVKMAGGAVLRSVAASTKVAPKTRPAVVKETMVQVPLKSGRLSKPRKRKQYGVNIYTRSGPVFQIVFGARTKTDVKRSKMAQIRRRGLAKRAWVQIGKYARISVPGGGAAGYQATNLAFKATSAEHNFKGDDPYISMHNRLGYATKALKGGAQDIATAMARAGRAMNQMIDRKLAQVAK